VFLTKIKLSVSQGKHRLTAINQSGQTQSKRHVGKLTGWESPTANTRVGKARQQIYGVSLTKIKPSVSQGKHRLTATNQSGQTQSKRHVGKLTGWESPTANFD